MEKPIIKENKYVRTPKFSELIEVDGVFENHISIGNDEYTVLNTMKNNDFEYYISENHISITNERIYSIRYLFENKTTPNNLWYCSTTIHNSTYHST